jgi:oligopeptide/dipeptide ABC transporter ATP-binding protein
MESQLLLNINHLKTYFYTLRGTVKAVDDLCLTVQPRESVGLVGESGCGKSTVAFSIMRLVPPPGRIVEGEISLLERQLLKLTDEEMRQIRGKDISMIFQDPMSFLNPVMRAKDQIADVIMLHHGKTKQDARKDSLKMLSMVQIPSPERVADYYSHQLSGGMRQRVVIGAALACRPSLLIADEPTTALDVTVQVQILHLMKELIKSTGTSLLLITHDLGIVADMCDRVYVMYAGKAVESGNVYSIYGRPAHPYTQGLLQAVLSIDEFKEKITTIEGVVPDLVNPPKGCRFHPRCSQAIDKCKEQEPLMIELGRGHRVACWLYK